MALHIPTGSLQTCSGLELVPTSPLADDVTTAPSGLVEGNVLLNALDILTGQSTCCFS